MVNSFDINDKTTCYFAIDKERSLDIIRSIIAAGPVYVQEQEMNLYKNKLSIVELNLDLNETDYIENYYNEIISCSNTNDYSISNNIDIDGISITNDNNIFFNEAYFYETQMECDWSIAEFSYNEQFQMWIIVNKSNHGIDYNGFITILNFNRYKEDFE